ncbi:hypothetical protein GFS31_18800 [Leptolyngbya sp. BL0902]|nr:hypothetical protein GFS31_18800 [Leptolyngbya sp. BL0902]
MAMPRSRHAIIAMTASFHGLLLGLEPLGLGVGCLNIPE